MAEDDPGDKAGDSDGEARRARAAELHETIEQLKSGQAERGDHGVPPSPREFTDREAHEDEEDSADDS